MKYYHFKIIQIILFALSLYLYTRQFFVDDNVLTTTTTTDKEGDHHHLHHKAIPTKMMSSIDQSIFVWVLSSLLFIIAWNACGVNKTTSRIFVAVFTYKALIEVIQHLPTEHLQSIRSVIGESGNQYLDWYMGKPYPLTLQTLSLQAATIVFFGGILAFNIKLADRFWLVKSILVDWIGVIIALVSTAVYDAVKSNTTYFVVTLAYFFGANVLGFGTMKAIEYCWAIRSKKLNVAENVVFDTDNQSSSSSSSSAPRGDTTDYSKLSEEQLDEILSSPEHLEMDRAEDPSKIFINNLKAPIFIRSTIRSKELIATLLMMMYTLSNFIIQYYNQINLWQIAMLVGLCTTLLAYLTTISSKRLTTKETSKREC